MFIFSPPLRKTVRRTLYMDIHGYNCCDLASYVARAGSVSPGYGRGSILLYLSVLSNSSHTCEIPIDTPDI